MDDFAPQLQKGDRLALCHDPYLLGELSSARGAMGWALAEMGNAGIANRK
jgi:hypothetical protein